MPLALLKLVYRGLKAPAYWQRWPERFGFFPQPPQQKTLWVHAVSVGEVQAAVSLVNALQDKYPDYLVLVTTTTPTGLAQAKRVFKENVVVGHLPYDLPGAVKRFLKRAQPAIAIIMETELWPNLFFHCHRQGIPLMIANGRLSPRSTRGYRRIQAFVRQTLENVQCIAVQSEGDGQRFIEIGAMSEQVFVANNIKFDMPVSQGNLDDIQLFRHALGENKKIWIAASTHQGEDEQILNAYIKIKSQYPELVLLLVPRHPERFDDVALLVQKQNLTLSCRSQNKVGSETTDVFLGDTMGELMFFYQTADIAFVGGSLVATGGHNVLEPVSVGVPCVVGPHTFNFVDIVDTLTQANALVQVNDVDELVASVKALLQNKEERQRLALCGKQVVEQNRGATASLMQKIGNLLKDNEYKRGETLISPPGRRKN